MIKIIFKILPVLIVLIFAFAAFFIIMSEIRKFDTLIDEHRQQIRINDALISEWIRRREEAPFLLPLLGSLSEEMILAEKDFIEVHLEKMIVRLYRNGVVESEYPILARGNKAEWGGSPTGLYNVLAKHRVAFSVPVRLYMPFAVQYYGMYFLHGIPYHPGGRRIVSEFSGGCIRLSDNNAKKIFDFVQEGMPVIVIDAAKEEFLEFTKEPTPFPELSAVGYIIADLKSGLVLAEENSLKRMSIASITKKMTAVVVSKHIRLNRGISISDEMLAVLGYTPGLKYGERYQLIELLYPLLIMSSNQAAEALAGFMGRDETIIAMNNKTRSIMMPATVFTDPSGLDEGNISTAQDLYYLARYIYYNRYPFWKISKGEKVPLLQRIIFDTEKLENKNIFIHDPTFIGGKTGYTEAAGLTGMFLFNLHYEGDERVIVMIFLNSEDLKRDTQKAYRWLLDNGFEMITKTI